MDLEGGHTLLLAVIFGALKMMVMGMLMMRTIVVGEHDDDVHSADDQVEPS